MLGTMVLYGRICAKLTQVFFTRKAKNAGIRTDGEASQRNEREKEQVKMQKFRPEEL
jgi:hypothetical protein